jgi:hypothetical protein
MVRSRLAIDISSDLVFSDPDLEEKYRKHHTDAQVRVQIGCCKIPVWLCPPNTKNIFAVFQSLKIIKFLSFCCSALWTSNSTMHVA